MLFPSKLRAFSSRVYRHIDEDVINGSICCPCGCETFVLLYDGVLNRRKLLHDVLMTNDSGYLAVAAECVSCKKIIPLFDSRTDGYSAQIDDEPSPDINAEPAYNTYVCKKCGANEFGVVASVEYSGMDDVEPDMNEADCYSWFWLEVVCKKCGKENLHLVDMETS